MQIQELEARGIRVDQELNILENDSQFSGQVRELDETDPRGTDALFITEGSVFLENDIHSTYLYEIESNFNHVLGNLDVEINGTEDSSIQRVDWTYSVLAESIEYLSEDNTLTESFTIALSENFVNFARDDVGRIDLNVEIIGTDDRPEIIVESIDDIDVVLREGKNNIASGELLISERDVNDQISIALQIPQSFV